MGRLAAALLVLVAAARAAAAQELEPRAYSASPVGATFLIGSYTRSTGSILFDPTLPITDVRATVEGAVLGAGRSFGLFGKTTSVAVAIPYAWADLTGRVGGNAASASRVGPADIRIRLAANLLGNPAMTTREFARARRKTILGTSVVVQLPSGRYTNTQLINIGNNRWGFKPEVGVSVPIRRVDADAYVGAWFFTSNDRFYPGDQVRTQDPVLAVQGHVSYTIRPRLWVAADATWYRGGASRVGDGPPSVALENSRAGVTMSVPIGGRYSLKAAYTSGVSVRTGTNFNTVSVAWQVLWLQRR
jgi:hypothetical protein